MQHLEVSGAVRPIQWPLGVKWLKVFYCVPTQDIYGTLRM